MSQIDISRLPMNLQLQQLALDRVDMEDNLYSFMKAAWPYMDPSPWTDGWPIEAVAEHMQAVCDGEIRRLLINIPPRCGKSSMTSVAFPAWVWAQPFRSPTAGPGVQFLHASYAKQLVTRDSVKCRALIESPWYQQYWGDRFTLSSDQNTKNRFSNDIRGERLTTSVDAGVTGEGGSIIIVDDPNAANEAFSDATIEATKEWWDRTMSTRLNDPKTGAFIVIQQRLAEDDLTGHILEKEADEWTHLCLPMRYERDRASKTIIGWEDPRRKEGELLWPERFGEPEVKKLERDLGPFAAAGQLQQRPEPQGGGIIKREWWQLWDQPSFPAFDYILGVLDTAYTIKEENDPSAMTVWGLFYDESVAQASRIIDADGRPMYLDRTFIDSAPKLMLMYAWTDRLEFNDLVLKTNDTAKKMKIDNLIIENKAAGHSVAQELRRLFSRENYGVELIDPKNQDKVARLYSVQHIFSEGMVFAPDKTWAETVITQVGQFPKGKHDDLVDTVSMGVRKLRDMGLLVRKEEHAQDMEALFVYPGDSSAPLYPC